MADIILTITSALFLAGFIMFMIENQKKKNAKKQADKEAKERAEVDKLFSEAPTGFLQGDCTERCYQDFIHTQLMERVN